MDNSAIILSIGNELLIGKTLDRNSNWIAEQLYLNGIRLLKIITLPDDPTFINASILQSVEEGIKIIFTTGGLGPSRDDITLSSIATSLEIPMQIDERALEMLKHKYKELYEKGMVDFPDITESRIKMALTPQYSIPIQNDIGAAPGIFLEYKNRYFISLPGVPSEMKNVFMKTLDILKEKIKLGQTFKVVELEINEKDESVLAPILAQVEKEMPPIVLKPLSEKFAKDTKLKVRFIVPSDKENLIQLAYNKILKLIHHSNE